MRLNDRASGVIAMMFGLLVVLQTRTFPPMPGQPIGPSLFPVVIGCALILTGLLLAVTGGRSGGPFLRAEDWVRKPRMVVNFVLVVALLLFYAAVLHRVGFFLTAFVFLTVLFLAFGVTRKWILPLSAITILLIHYGFYTLLRVPLPWGVFEGIAW